MPLETDLNGPLKIRGEEDNIHREGSEQQSSKSVCHSPYRSEPLVESRSCPDDMEELFLQQRKKKVNIKLDEQSTLIIYGMPTEVVVHSMIERSGGNLEVVF